MPIKCDTTYRACEANPHLISVEQLLRILSILHARLVIQDLEPPPDQEKTILGISLRKGEWRNE